MKLKILQQLLRLPPALMIPNIENSTKTGCIISFKLNIVGVVEKKIANPKLIEYCKDDKLKN